MSTLVARINIIEPFHFDTPSNRSPGMLSISTSTNPSRTIVLLRLKFDGMHLAGNLGVVVDSLLYHLIKAAYSKLLTLIDGNARGRIVCMASTKEIKAMNRYILFPILASSSIHMACRTRARQQRQHNVSVGMRE